MTCIPPMTITSLFSTIGITSNLGRAARLPASAGAGLTCQGAGSPGSPQDQEDLREPFLTYSEIGQALCESIDAGIITPEQSEQIANILFPIQE